MNDGSLFDFSAGLTEERRKELSKQAKAMCEQAGSPISEGCHGCRESVGSTPFLKTK